MNEAQSAMLVLRLCSFETDDKASSKILIPCAGGPHSRLAPENGGRDGGERG